MASTTAVTPRARTLAGMLKASVDASDFSARALAKRMDVSHVTVGRWLRGEVVPDAETVSAMLAHIGVNGEDREQILAVARKTGEPDWLTTGETGIPQQLAGVLEFEATAVGMTDWSPLFVPGMLQTANYARTIIGTDRDLDRRTVEHLVTLRMGRQNSIMRDRPIHLNAFVGEPAIRGGIGGPEVMGEQLRSLVRASDMFDAVTIRVVPVDGSWHGGLAGPFVLYDFSDEPSIVHFEHLRTGAFVSDPDDVARYTRLREELNDVAWSGEQTRTMLLDAIK